MRTARTVIGVWVSVGIGEAVGEGVAAMVGSGVWAGEGPAVKVGVELTTRVAEPSWISSKGVGEGVMRAPNGSRLQPVRLSAQTIRKMQKDFLFTCGYHAG
jgi:hypothetical protein